MYKNFVYDDVTEALPKLLHTLEQLGTEQPSRNGLTRELTHIGITLEKPWQRELLIPERKANLAAQIAETMWVLAGRNDVAFLENYLPRAKDFSDDGITWRGGYGPRIRDYADEVDQLSYVVELLRENRDDRRAVINIWDAVIDAKPGKDLPCNGWLHFLCRNGKLDLHVAIRSNDIIWGWSGINAFEWSALQEIVAGMAGVEVGSLHFSISSLHLYEPHFAKSSKIVHAYLTGEKNQYYGAPIEFNATGLDDMQSFDELVRQWFEIEELIRLGEPVGQLLDLFPEPMLQSWLRVLQWWWSGDKKFLPEGRLAKAAKMAMQPKVQPNRYESSPFVRYVDKLHCEKHAAYGDSWKRRGEMLGIMANIARKIDRLGTTDSNETSADTAIDLLVYLAKYRWWLSDQIFDVPLPCSTAPLARGIYSDHTRPVRDLLCGIGGRRLQPKSVPVLQEDLTDGFETLEAVVMSNGSRWELVDIMLQDAFQLAAKLWEHDNS